MIEVKLNIALLQSIWEELSALGFRGLRTRLDANHSNNLSINYGEKNLAIWLGNDYAMLYASDWDEDDGGIIQEWGLDPSPLDISRLLK